MASKKVVAKRAAAKSGKAEKIEKRPISKPKPPPKKRPAKKATPRKTSKTTAKNTKSTKKNVPDTQKEKPKKPEVVYLEDSFSESSSSEEDSDDEFTLENEGSSRKRSTFMDSSSSEDECEGVDLEEDELFGGRSREKLNTSKKSLKKTIGFQQDEEDPDIQVVDDRQSLKAKIRLEEQRKRDEENGVTVRKVRKQRVKLRMTPTNEPKRRKIYRSNNDLTVPYTSGTFIEFIPTVNNLLTDIEDDRDVDLLRLDLLENDFEEVDVKDLKECVENEELNDEKAEFGPANQNDNDADDIFFGIVLDRKHRIAKQTAMTEFQNNPFAEKLAGYIPHPAISGNYRSLVQSYHPDMLADERYYEAPSMLVWNRPFDHLIHQKQCSDINRDAKKYVDLCVESNLQWRERKLLDEVRQRAREIALEQSAERKRKAVLGFTQNLQQQQFHEPLLVIEGTTSLKREINYRDEANWIDDLDDIQIIED